MKIVRSKNLFLFLEMAYIPLKESHPQKSHFKIFSTRVNFNVIVKVGYYEEFYPQQPLSETYIFKWRL